MPQPEPTLTHPALALEQLSDGFLICDAHQISYPITFVSDNFCELTGYDRKEIMGQSCHFLQGKDTNPKTVQAIRLALQQHRAFRGKILNYRKDGSPFWNLLRIEPIKNEQGEVIQFLGNQTDLSGIIDEDTEKLHTQLATTQLEIEHSHHILSSMGDTKKIGVFQADASGYIVSADQVCGEFVSKTEDQLLGDAWISALHQDDCKNMVAKWSDFVQSNRTTHEDVYRVNHANGTLTLKTHASKKTNSQGEVISIIGFVVNLTDELLPVRQGAKFKLLLNRIDNLLSIGTFEMNTDGSLRWCNHCMENITGIPAGQAVEAGWQKNVHPDDIERVTQAWLGFINGNFIDPYLENLRLVVNGETRHIRVLCEPILMDDQLTGFIGCMWHRTEDHQRQQQIEALQARIELTETLGELAYWQCNTAGEVTHYDRTAATLFGATHVTSMLGMNWLNTIGEKDRERVRHHWNDFIQNATELDSFYEQYQIDTPNGQTHIRIKGKGIFKTNQLQFFSGVVIDISEEIRHKERFNHLQRQYTEIQHATHTGSWEWDTINNSTWWSEHTYELLELDPRQISASHENYLRCLTPRCATLAQSKIEKILQDGINYEHHIQIKTNPNKILLGRFTLVADANNKPLKLCGTIQDVTQHIQEQQQLKQDTQRLEEITDEAAQALQEIAQGTLDSDFTPKHKYHPILIAIKQLRATLKQFSTELTRVTKEVGIEGKLGGQANIKNVHGAWAELTENVNTMAENLTNQVREISQYAEYLADGVLDYQPDINSPGEIKQLVDNLARVQSNITRVLATAEKITQGDFSSEVEPVSKYDILGVAVNSMTQSLKAKTEKLSQNTILLDEFLHNSSDIFIRLDPKFNILYLSQAFYNLIGETKKQLIGMPANAVSPELTIEKLKQKFKISSAVKNNNNNNTGKTIRFSMSIEQDTFIFQAAYWPIRNVHGQIKEYHLLARNITEQESVAARNQLLYHTLNNIEPFFGIAKLNNLELIWTNKQSTEKHNHSLTIGNYHSKKQMQYFQEYILPALKKEYFWQGEWGMLDAQGKEYPTYSQVSLHLGKDNHPNLISALMTDISEQQQQKEEATHRRNQINRLMSAAVVSEAATSLAHQLNQPLASISSTLQLWQSSLKNNTKSKMTNRISIDGKHLDISAIDDMVEKTFAMGKLIHHVNSAVKRSDFSSDWAFLQDIIEEAKDNALSPKIRIQFLLHIEPILQQKRIYVDDVLLNQILTNLFSNAHDSLVDANHANNLIEIHANLQNNTLLVEIKDNGTGIPADRKNSIFEPFYSTKDYGSGIGLSWVKSTVETMGGQIALSARQPQPHGAAFTLTFPIVLEE